MHFPLTLYLLGAKRTNTAALCTDWNIFKIAKNSRFVKNSRLVKTAAHFLCMAIYDDVCDVERFLPLN